MTAWFGRKQFGVGWGLPVGGVGSQWLSMSWLWS